MAAGGKRLRRDSGARSVGASDQTGTRAAATPTNATAITSNRVDNDLPSPASSQPAGHPAKGSQRSDVYNEHSIQDASNRMQQYYTLFPTKEEALEHLCPNMKKEEWAISELFSTEEFQSENEINCHNRAKIMVAHTSSAWSFQQALVLMKDAEIDQTNSALMYKKTHINKDSAWTSDIACLPPSSLNPSQSASFSQADLKISMKLGGMICMIERGQRTSSKHCTSNVLRSV
ncbi:hypothetical protein CJ030_MR2G026828 [Morella rubra]|uniref:Uncharacterized protein n=1 Tax=Morella rubra TaxID=262757 RepID=A0A6A1WBR9_9ROSI|nr:hypothetical protein CJ030_MR2G026828 [Morella rubra]